MRDHLYMIVDLEENELPLFVGTAKEVAEYAGINETSVRGLAYKREKYGMKGKYIRVEFED